MINQGHFQQSSIRGTSKMSTCAHFFPLLTHFFIYHFSSFRRIASIVGTFVEEIVWKRTQIATSPGLSTIFQVFIYHLKLSFLIWDRVLQSIGWLLMPCHCIDPNLFCSRPNSLGPIQTVWDMVHKVKFSSESRFWTRSKKIG